MTLPANTVIEDTTEEPRRNPAPGTPQQRHVDNRPAHVREAATEMQVVDTTEVVIQVPLHSPDDPFVMTLRRPIMSSKAGGKLAELTISPPRAEAFCAHGHFVKNISKQMRDPQTGATETESWYDVDYTVMLKHLASATGVSLIELKGMSAPDMERASGVLYSMSSGLPFK